MNDTMSAGTLKDVKASSFIMSRVWHYCLT